MRSAIAAGAIAIFIAGCAAPSAIKDLLPESMKERESPVIASLPKEFKPSPLALGKEVDLDNRRTENFGLVPLPVMERYLNDVLTRLKAKTGIPDLPGTVYIAADEFIDVSTTADANIYISWSLLQNFETEDEVAAVLAHELAHIVFGHVDSDIASNLQKQFQTTFAIGAEIHAKLDANDSNAKTSDKNLQTLQKMQILIELTDDVLLPAWNREQEQTADYFAIDLLARSGYSYTRGMKSFLEKLEGIETDEKERRETARKNRMEVLAKSGNPDLGAILRVSMEGLTDFFKSRHYPAADRAADTAKYHANFYGNQPKGKVHEAEWKRVQNDKFVVQTFANYKLAAEVIRLSEQNNSGAALQMARRAASFPTADHSFPLYSLAKVQLSQGDERGFEQTIQRGMQSPHPSWKFYDLMATREYDRGRRERATQIMEIGYKRFHESPALKPTMIGFYAKVGKKDKADALSLDCTARNPNMREACAGAAGPPGLRGSAPGKKRG